MTKMKSGHKHEGLVFAIPLGETDYGFGQLIKFQHVIYYMAAYDIRRTTPSVTPEELQAANVVLLGNFFDGLLKQGRWIALFKMPPPPVPYPCYKVKTGDNYYVENWDEVRSRVATPEEVAILPNRSNKAPMILEDALKWHFGLHPEEHWFKSITYEFVDRISRFASSGRGPVNRTDSRVNHPDGDASTPGSSSARTGASEDNAEGKAKTVNPDFPNDITGSTLRQMHARGADLSKVHAVEFFAALPDESSGKDFASWAQKCGFDVATCEDETGAGWAVRCTKNMVPDYAAIRKVEAEIEAVAAQHGGEADGWGASIVK